MTTIRFEGKLVQTTKKAITEECFNDLIANGRESSFYHYVREVDFPRNCRQTQASN